MATVIQKSHSRHSILHPTIHYLLNAIHNHLPVLLIFIFEILHDTTGDLCRPNLIGNLNSSVHKLQKKEREA